MQEQGEVWQQQAQADMHATLMRCFVQLVREQHAQRAQLLERGLCQVLRLPVSASMPCCRYCPCYPCTCYPFAHIYVYMTYMCRVVTGRWVAYYIVKQDCGRPAVCTAIYIPTDRRLSKTLLYYVYATHLPVTTLHMCVNHTPANYTPTGHTSHAYCCILQIAHSSCIHQLCTPTMYNNPPPSTHHVRRGSM